MTRPNATVMLNFHPIHSRAGQLSLLRRWIKADGDLLSLLGGYQDMRRIIKARVSTDIVSFCDSLVTRALPVGAPQTMDGLDTLLTNVGHSSSTISDFVRLSDFTPRLASIRAVRDEVGAHLEKDVAVPLSQILHDLDALDMTECLDFYDRVKETFEKTCRGILYLRTYSRGDIRLNGLSMTAASTAHAPFGKQGFRQALPPGPIDYNSTDNYSQKLDQWLTGDDNSREDARFFFYTAFMAAEKIEKIIEQDNFNSGGSAGILMNGESLISLSWTPLAQHIMPICHVYLNCL